VGEVFRFNLVALGLAFISGWRGGRIALLFFLNFLLTGFFSVASTGWISRREFRLIRLDFVLIRLFSIGFEKSRFASRLLDVGLARCLGFSGV
jgi:hypothetical protein